MKHKRADLVCVEADFQAPGQLARLALSLSVQDISSEAEKHCMASAFTHVDIREVSKSIGISQFLLSLSFTFATHFG